MNLLILGDVMGVSGRRALSDKLPDLIKTNKIKKCHSMANPGCQKVTLAESRLPCKLLFFLTFVAAQVLGTPSTPPSLPDPIPFT